MEEKYPFGACSITVTAPRETTCIQIYNFPSDHWDVVKTKNTKTLFSRSDGETKNVDVKVDGSRSDRVALQNLRPVPPKEATVWKVGDECLFDTMGMASHSAVKLVPAVLVEVPSFANCGTVKVKLLSKEEAGKVLHTSTCHIYPYSWSGEKFFFY